MRRTGIVGAYKGSMASEVTITKEEWEQMKAADHSVPGGDGTPGSTGGKAGAGGTAGFAQHGCLPALMRTMMMTAMSRMKCPASIATENQAINV